MVQKEFHSLESWVKNNAQKHIDKLAKNLSGDLSETELRWECEAQIDIVSSLREAWQKKLDYIKTVLGTMETEVLGAPIADSEEAKDTRKTDNSHLETWTEPSTKQNRHLLDGKYLEKG